MDILAIIVITLFIALITNIVLKKLHLPVIIGYIFTGIIIAYSLGFHKSNHDLTQLAEFGIVFLMFSIGLEFSASKLKKMRFWVFGIGSLQIIITGILSFLVSYFGFNLDAKTSTILALIIPLSSTAIVLNTLNKTGEISRKYGHRSLGILLMQDLAVIPILLIIGFLASSGQTLGTAFIDIIINGTILVVAMFLTAKYLLEPCVNQVVKTSSDELFIIAILFLAIGSSYLAHALGFSYSLGAFIAGMLIAETKYKHQVLADLVPFRDLLLGVFFITVGMQIHFDIIFKYFDIILLVLLLVFALKFLVIFTLIKFKENSRVAIKTAFALVQVGEFSLAALELVHTNNLILEKYSQIILAVIVISMILTPIILKKLDRIADFFVPKVAKTHPFSKLNKTRHIVLIGFGTFGKSVAKDLKKNHKEYLIIENNIDIYHKGLEAQENIIFGNAAKSEILKTADVRSASFVIVAVENLNKINQVCHNLQKFIDKSKIIVRLHSVSDLEVLDFVNLENIIIENELTTKQISKIINV
jgi:CPA2 family monovalent cation:H+ antiporter-2